MSKTIDHNRDSVYARIGGVLYKSCPCCTRRDGELVMMPVSEFGVRVAADTGRAYVQTWCSPCRSAASTEAVA